jgi:CMP/dCMP kinase
MRIAISGHSGCGNTTATTNVGKSLSLRMVNYTFRDLAKDVGLTFDEVQKQASENPLFDYLTDLQLVRAALNPQIVLGTRLASWLMEADLRIWLHASLEARAARISKRETEKASSYEHVLYKTLKRDEENRKRYLRLYGIDILDHSDFDMTINTEKLTAEQVSGLIVAAAQWASNNKLERKNIHLKRIREIIAENLELPLEALTDASIAVDVRAIFQSLQSRR